MFEDLFRGMVRLLMFRRYMALNDWVAVKELELSYYIGETLLFTIYIYTHYGNFI